MHDFFRLITLQDGNTRVVLLGATVLGIAAAIVGCFAVLRKRSLVGDAVAHAALPGICLAYFIVGDRSFIAFLIGALLMGVLATGFVSLVRSMTRVKEDAAIAIAIGGFFGLGVALSRMIQNEPSGNRAGLDGFIFGKAASMVRQDAQLILIAAAVVVGIVLLLYKEFKVLCFDTTFAAGQGWPTLLLDLVLMALVCVCTVVGLPAVGVVLVVALLVIPSVAARFWTDKLSTLLIIAGSIGGLSGMLGTALSAVVPAPAGSLTRGWPTGPVIVLVAAGMFIISLLAAPKRGLIADVLRRRSLRRRIAIQNLLRDAYETLEAGGDLSLPWQPDHLGRASTDHTRAAHRAIRAGYVHKLPSGFALTPEGQAAAARVVRTHRLWELYLIEQADIAPDHVDRDADEIEHVLPHELVSQLHWRLASEGRLPVGDVPPRSIPTSPHPLPQKPPTATRILPALAFAGLLTLSATDANAAERAIFHLGSYAVGSNDLWTIATAACCAIACGVLGCFLVLRRLSLLGDAISHAILPGLAGAFLLTGSRDILPMLIGAMLVGVMTAVLSAGLNRWGRVPEDASMGVVFTTLFALGVVLITFAAKNVDLDPGCVLYGLLEFVPFDTTQILGVQVPRAFVWLLAALTVNVALILVFFKELKIVSFDPYLATTMGISATLVHYGLMTAVAATSVASFEAVGSILVIAMLVAPGATAQLITDKLGAMLFWAAGIAALCAVLGYIGAVWLNTSIAGMVAATSLAVFLLAVVASPTHGLIAKRLRTRASRSQPPPDLRIP